MYCMLVVVVTLYYSALLCPPAKNHQLGEGGHVRCVHRMPALRSKYNKGHIHLAESRTHAPLNEGAENITRPPVVTPMIAHFLAFTGTLYDSHSSSQNDNTVQCSSIMRINFAQHRDPSCKYRLWSSATLLLV